MKARATATLVAAVSATAALALLLTLARPSPLPQGNVGSLAPIVDHGPEPTIGGFPPNSQVTANANFWADDATTAPERLSYLVSLSEVRNLSEPPRVSQASEVRDGKRYVSVHLDFPYGTVTEASSVDLTVKFTNAAGQSASRSMTIDRN